MKKLLFLFILLTASLSQAQNTNTTYFLIRHAEKADQSKDTDLSKEGLERAVQWNKILEDISFDAVYCTIYKRTRQTAQFIAERSKKEITQYNHKEIDIEKFKKETSGKTVLIVGHSNSIPNFVNALIGKTKYKEIDENVFGNLYIVSIKGDTITDYLLHL